MTALEALAKFGRLAHYMAARHVRPGIDADDLRQEAQLALLIAIGTWDRDTTPSFRLWAGWQIRNALRRFTSARTGGYALVSLDAITSGDDGHSLHDIVADDGVDVDDGTARGETIAMVRRTLATMAVDDRALLLATESQDAVAAELGIPRSTVTGRTTRALRRFGEHLGVSTLPPKRSRASRAITWRGETRTVAQWSRHVGIPRRTLNARLARGWDLDAALSAMTSLVGRPPGTP